jgi:hypothetical protein
VADVLEAAAEDAQLLLRRQLHAGVELQDGVAVLEVADDGWQRVGGDNADAAVLQQLHHALEPPRVAAVRLRGFGVGCVEWRLQWHARAAAAHSARWIDSPAEKAPDAQKSLDAETHL